MVVLIPIHLCVHTLTYLSTEFTMSVYADEYDKAGASLVDVLPVEMIRAICENLLVEDVANFRLTSKVCAAAGVDRLVQVVYVTFTRESFQKLPNISKHPEISKHVITTWYEPLGLVAWDGNEFHNRGYGLTDLRGQENSKKTLKVTTFGSNISCFYSLQ